MIAKIQPSNISGTIQAPTSKSSMQRACAAALLVGGKTTIVNPGKSNDDKAAIDIITRLGAIVDTKNEKVTVTATGVHPISDTVNCGESGLSIRMFTPIIALSDQSIAIDGEGSLLNRPMDFFDQILPQLGVVVQSNQGKLPIIIRGPLQPRDIEIDGSLSSQFLTGLLMAYSAAGANGVSIKVNNLASRPYIDLTLDVMKRFGLAVPENKDYREFIFTAGSSSIIAEREYQVECDWSGGSFLLVAGAIAGAITIRGLDLMSTQADKAIMKALSAAHAGYAVEAKGIKIRPAEMQAFKFDATDCPDLFPPLVALAAYCNGETRIKGVTRLAHKESDRATALQVEFGKLGVQVEINGDLMIIRGTGHVKGSKVHSHHDHRIAMACAVAALKAEGETEVEGSEAVKKSYPGFYDDLKKLGASVSLGSTIKFHE